MTADRQCWNGRPVLVTGGTGFIGSNLVRRLLELQAEVTVLVPAETPVWRLDELRPRLRWIVGDLEHLRETSLAQAAPAPQVIFHLAAAGVSDADTQDLAVIQNNVMGTAELLRLAAAMKVERFIYCGSCFEYPAGDRLTEDCLPEPVSEYGASKSAAWLLAHAFGRRYGLPVVSVRPFMVYGPFEAAQRLIPYVIGRSLDHRPLELTGGQQVRDFVFVADAIEGFLQAAQQPSAVSGTFNLASGIGTSVQSLVGKILRLMGSASAPNFGARAQRHTEIPVLCGDPSRASHELGWTATTTLEAGLEQTIEWFRHNRQRYAEYAPRR